MEQQLQTMLQVDGREHGTSILQLSQRHVRLVEEIRNAVFHWTLDGRQSWYDVQL